MSRLTKENWTGRSVVVLGLARSGVAVAKLLHRLGARVVVNDLKPRSACPEANELEALGIPVICGEHPDDLIHEQVEMLVKNPGIPYRAKPVQQALAAGVPVVTEVEIAGALSKAPMIGITGSNGKTTTTSLVGQILTRSQVKCTVAGNIGQALADVVERVTSDEWLVAELSSFQLKGTEQFRPRIAALLNVFPAHLDYHETMEDYVASKRKIFANQEAGDIAVLNADSPVCREVAKTISSDIWWFSRTVPVEQGVYAQDGVIYVINGGQTQAILPVDEVALHGDFNLENALAATAITLAAGARLDAVAQTLREFHGVEHRLEYVATINGVRYYNDSKATNAQAAIKALEAFTEPVVWIGGGLDRGVDFKELVPVLRGRAKAVITYGQSKSILAERGRDAGVPAVQVVDDLEEAVNRAAGLAQDGDVVLLSPACASWDQYTSFEERGSIFKQAVHRLQV
ncbi:UDP-N-acetylmuramoyl-L-alanine--D-glutamate ligase [Laceyella sacchari]|uniref:UDP-N-acetylmuramoylalanine--D-glutamate ligase n=1 Tax=Laceyella tengchongensis TaxID=574699 RepID=A0AA45WLH1_9BACL|nr:UDP-N-acetylmuramoyl-L-alanine--D-glutamate ligase [Laceyella tengchongensis]AUS09345.1 UDP-N-acetylmuramoyl-L-alanine--D-glutamate ligase [Laceyella sacchari]MRG26946.1 UDP-N-acetylmuramoyl-L-alanine--D-glutamate ligase [Laceyella tengchongensis]SMP10912.1 UDP-N-acetylmuramoylalanine--D-glutamate ligase [Laceyella tengchongensis]